MNILHFYKTYYPDTFGGIEKLIEQISQGVAPLGVRSDILSLTPLPHAIISQKEEITSYRVPRLFEIASTPFSYHAFSKFVELAQKADVIHFHFPWPFGDLVHLYARVVHGIKTPYVITYHSDIINQKYYKYLYKPLMHQFFSGAAKIIGTSPFYVETSPVLKKISSDKIDIIPIGLDEKDYTVCPKKIAYWQERLPQPFVLFIGMPRYYKGLDYLFEAAKELNGHLVCVGKEPSHEENDRYFLGALPNEDKNAILSLCKAVVLPSHLRSEAFGISLVEGALFGKPLVSCEIGTGTTYINRHNETGLVVEPGSVGQLVVALNTLFENSSLADRLGQGARARYLELFTAQKMAQSYVDLYRKVRMKI